MANTRQPLERPLTNAQVIAGLRDIASGLFGNGLATSDGYPCKSVIKAAADALEAKDEIIAARDSELVRREQDNAAYKAEIAHQASLLVFAHQEAVKQQAEIERLRTWIRAECVESFSHNTGGCPKDCMACEAEAFLNG